MSSINNFNGYLRHHSPCDALEEKKECKRPERPITTQPLRRGSNTSSSAFTSLSTISAYNPEESLSDPFHHSKAPPLEFNPKLAHVIQEKRSSAIEELIKVRDADDGDLGYRIPASVYEVYEVPLLTSLKREGFHLEPRELERYTLVLDVLEHNYPRLESSQPEYHRQFETFLNAQEPGWDDYATSGLSYLNLLDARNQMHNYVQDCAQQDKDFSRESWSYFFLASSFIDPTGTCGKIQSLLDKTHRPKKPHRKITKGDVFKAYKGESIPPQDFEGVAKLGLGDDANQDLQAAMGKGIHGNKEKADELESGLGKLEENMSLFSERLKQLENPQIKRELKQAEKLPKWKENCTKALQLAEAVTHSFSVYAQRSKQAFAEREQHRHVRSRMQQTTLFLKKDYSDLTNGRGAVAFTRNITSAKEAIQELNFQQKQIQSFLEQRRKLEADGADVGQALADLNQKLEESYRKMQKAHESTNKFLRGAEVAVDVAAAAVSIYTGGTAAPAAAVGKGAFQALLGFLQREQLKENTRLQNRIQQMEATSFGLHQTRQDNQAHSQSLYYNLKNLSAKQLAILQKDPRLFSFYQEQLDAYKVLVTQNELDPTVKKIQTCEQELEQLKAAKEKAERGLSPFTGKAKSYDVQLKSGMGHAALSISLHDISRKDLKKQDEQLVQTHAKSKDNVKSIEWNEECGVVIIEKHGKFYVYRLGGGAHPELFKSKKKSEALDFVNNKNQEQAQTNYQTAQTHVLQKELELQNLNETKKSAEDELQDVETATENAKKAQGVKAVTAEYLDSGLFKFLEILYGPSDDPRQQAIDEGLEKIALCSETGKELVLNVLRQLKQFAPVFDRFVEGSNFKEKMLPEGFSLEKTLHKPSLVMSKITTICEGLYNIHGAYKLHMASPEELQKAKEAGPGKLEAAAALAKVGSAFIHPAIPVVIASLELIMLLKEEEQQVGPDRIEILGKNLCKLHDHMLEGIGRIHEHLHAIHKDTAAEFDVTRECLEIVQGQLTHEVRALKETIYDASHRQTVSRKCDLVHSKTSSFRSQPQIGNCIDYVDPLIEISLGFNNLRCVFRAFKTELKEMDARNNTGLWLSQDTSLSLSPISQMEIVARHPEYSTGFLAETFGISHAPSFYHYEHYTYMFCRFAAMAIRKGDHERYKFQEEIAELSEELLYKGKALQQVFSTEVLQCALVQYQERCLKLLAHLQEGESQLIRRREGLLVGKGKEWLSKTSVLQSHYSVDVSQLEVRGSQKFSFLKFLTRDPIKTEDIQRIANPEAYDHMLSSSECIDPLVWFFEKEGFWGSVQLTHQLGPKGIWDFKGKRDELFIEDDKLTKERRLALATLSGEMKAREEKPPIAWLEDDSVQKIDSVQRDLIKGNFLEVAYEKHDVGDRQVAFSNHSSRPRPLHSHILFPKDYYLSENLRGVVHECSSKSSCWAYERSVSTSKNHGSKHSSYGAYFSLIQTQAFQNNHGLRGRTFFFVSSVLRETLTRLSFLSSLGTQLHLTQLGSTGLCFDFQGREHKKMLTSPDGACALHALLGTLASGKGYYHKGVREYFARRLRLRMQEYQSNTQQVPPHVEAIKELLQQIIKEHLDRAVDPQGNDLSSLMLFPRDKKGLLVFWSHPYADERRWVEEIKPTDPKVEPDKEEVFPQGELHINPDLLEEVIEPDSRPGTPDSAYGDGKSSRGVISPSEPSTSVYGTKLESPAEFTQKELSALIPKFWEMLGLKKEQAEKHVIGIKIAKCWQLLKASHQEEREALKGDEAKLWLDQLKDKVLSTVLERVKKAKPQHPLYKKTEEQVLKMLDEEPRLLLNIVCTEYEEFFKLLEDGDSKKAIEDAKIKQKKLSDKQEEQLNAFALSKTVYERYLSTAMRETQSDQDLGFYFNTQEIHLAALLFDKKAQVVAKQQGKVLPASKEFNAQLPSTCIVIYHEANHFSRCDPTAALGHTHSLRVIKTPEKEKAYDDAIKGLVKDYAEFVEKHLKGEALLKKSDNSFHVLGDKDHKFQLLPPFKNKELLPLAFPIDLMKEIEKTLSFRDIVGIPVPYYTFQLSAAKDCYELCIEYQVFTCSSDTKPKGYCSVVVAQVGVDIVETFHLVDEHLVKAGLREKYKIDLSHNEFLIQAMYTHLKKETLGLPGKGTWRAKTPFERTIVTTEAPFEGLFRQFQAAPTQKVRVGYNPALSKGELEFFENQLEMRAKPHYSLIQKELLLKKKKQVTEKQGLDLYKKAKQGQYLVEALLKIGAQASVLETFKTMTNPDTMTLVPETIQDKAGEPTHREKAQKICLNVVKEHTQKPSMEREYLESHLKNLSLIQAENEEKESKEQFSEILDYPEPFSDYGN